MCIRDRVNDMTVKETKVITILNKAGEDFALVAIPYNPTTKVSDIKVELFDSSGKLIKKFGKSDFSDYTNNRSAALYVDAVSYTHLDVYKRQKWNSGKLKKNSTWLK